MILALVVLHLSLIHLDESTNADEEYVEFYYYYFIKDLFVFFLIIIVFSHLVFFDPNYLSHPDNYTMASISVTPAHLVPEWYFLPFYAVLRSTPDKFGGLLLMFLTLVDFFLLDLLLDDEEDLAFLSVNQVLEEELDEDEDTASLFVLFFLGGRDIDEPYTELSSILTFLQFLDYFDLNLSAAADE